MLFKLQYGLKWNKQSVLLWEQSIIYYEIFHFIVRMSEWGPQNTSIFSYKVLPHIISQQCQDKHGVWQARKTGSTCFVWYISHWKRNRKRKVRYTASMRRLQCHEQHGLCFLSTHSYCLRHNVLFIIFLVCISPSKG